MNKRLTNIASFTQLLCFFSILFTLAACDNKTSENSKEVIGATSTPPTEKKKQNLLGANIKQTEQMFSSGHAALNTSLESAKALTQGIESFLRSPTQENLSKTQTLWMRATIDYRSFNFFRHIGLVEPSIFARINRLDYQVSGFPIQPGFLDTFGAYKYSGLVHDISFPISEESLTNLHGLTDLGDIVLGLYAIEFLLFNAGQARDIKDFIKVVSINDAFKEQGFKQIEELPNNRRRKLLTQQAQILQKNIHQLSKDWSGDKKTSAQHLWEDIEGIERLSIIQRATKSSLTELMIEIGELNSTEIENTRIPPGIYNAQLSEQKSYIYRALQSIQQGAVMLNPQTESKITDAISKAIQLTQPNKENDKKPKKEYWREVFSAVKNSSDAIAHTE